MAGAIFIPSAFLHFSLSLIEQHKKYFKVIISCYLASVLFLLLDFTPLFVKDVRLRLSFPYWPTAGITYAPFLAMFLGLTIYAHVLMFKHYRRLSGLKRNQIKYVFLGTAIGFLGGSTNYPLWYNIPIPPVGNVLVAVYVFLVAYAIIRYRLMDITIFAIRTAIFFIVYGIILVLPLLIFFASKPILDRFSIGFYALLASTAPFIYIYFRRRAEDILLKDQRRYQNTLRQLSATLTLIKNLERLLKFIIFKVSRAVKVDFACVYLANENKLIQKYPYTIKGFFPNFPKELSFDSDLIGYITSKHRPIFAEELISTSDSFNLRTGLIAPSFVKRRLLGFLVLGPKSSGAIYNQEDANIFGILANQIALAIENTEFIEESQKIQAQLFAAEQMASMGTMAGGMTHQINNRFHSIALATSDTIDTLNLFDLEHASKGEIKDTFEQIRHALERIQENTSHGGKIINDFLSFSQPERMQRETKEFDLRGPLEKGIEMVRIKTAFPEEAIEKEIQECPLRINGNFVLIQDAFFNINDNAIDALDKKDKAIKNRELNEPIGGYKGKVKIRIYKETPSVIIKIQDNGIGMTEEVRKKLFVPFFTTKATSTKGTGLGLFVIKKIIEAYDGTIGVESEYGKGTTFTIKLPLAKNT
jgi:two-component system nitrogen regulation sensor histidine kinase GlnL